MIVNWSEEAVSALRERFQPSASVWKLVSDAEGCGCAMNGVPALWAINAPAADDVRADSGPIELWYEKRHEIFFEDVLRISYDPSSRSFKLLSDGQIYTNQLATIDLRTASGLQHTNKE